MQLSILELGRVREGSDRRAALDAARDLARHAEQLGYARFWVAEHHNMRGVSTAATPVVIAHIAGGTEKIRVGAGGVMLPNHTPYVIAEQFGTLAELFPNRIDLGLGRAPGTDQLTLRALRRDPRSADRFPEDVIELQHYLEPTREGQAIEAVPGSGTRVPLWILGSSLFGAELAAKLGLPFGFASHFAPGALMDALDVYRSGFQPSRALSEPYAMAGINIVAAETNAEARRLATTQQVSVTHLIRGERGLSQPPIDDIEGYWSPAERAHVMRMLSCSVVGDADKVRAGMQQFAERTGVQELMIVSDVFEPSARFRSLEIIAESARTLP